MRPGRLRIKTAEILSDLFKMDVTPEQVQPATGYWRQADVYRWECLLWKSSRTISISLGCWESMADFVKNHRNGIILSRVADVSSKELTPDQCRGAVEIAALESKAI